MRAVSRDFIVGLTAIIGFAGLAGLLFAFGELAFLSRPGYVINLELGNASGVYAGSSITLNGVPVGEVQAARTNADPRKGVVLELKINEDVRVPRDVDVTLMQGLLGESTLALEAAPVPDDAPALTEADFLQPGDTFRRAAPGMLEQIASMLDSRFASIEDAATSFRQLSETYIRVGESIEKFVAPRSLEDVDAGATPNLASTVRRLDAAIADAQLWLGDEQIRMDAKATAENARASLERLADAVDAWTLAADAVSRNADRAGEGFDEAIAEFVRTTTNLNTTLGEVQFLAMRINAGEGTLGMLVENPDLYRSLNDAAIRLERALLETQLLVEKYRKEGVPIQF
ncbi:MAG: MlaD family protein [Planctomycetota bacterium]